MHELVKAQDVFVIGFGITMSTLVIAIAVQLFLKVDFKYLFNFLWVVATFTRNVIVIIACAQTLQRKIDLFR